MQPVTLAPGASLACTGSWTVTQADIDAGQVDNTGTADSVETPPVSTPKTVLLPQVTALSLVKRNRSASRPPATRWTMATA